MTEGSPLDAEVADAPARARRVGPIVAVSLISGLLAALALALLVFPGGQEHVITGAIMIAFALAWALLGAWSTRRTDQPQRWAFVPAASIGFVGIALLVFAPGANTIEALGWVWPPLLLALVVWMTLQARRRLQSRTRPWLLYPVFGFLALASIGGAYETWQEHHRVLPAGGRLVSVGGHRLYLSCTGTGNPTVVLEAGLGENASSWKKIAPAVSRQTKVCVYDRAGRGFSENASGAQNGAQTAAALETLLSRGGVPGPYVLVGFSLGGVYVLNFAQQFPDQVAGVVLLDSTSPEQFKLPGYTGFYDGLRRASGLVPPIGRLGVGRLLDSAYGGREARSFRDEIAKLPTALKQAQGLKSIGGKPLIVLTATRGQQVGWPSAQNALAALSTNSAHRHVAVDHHSLLDKPSGTARSTQAIRDVVRSARTARPITNG